MNWTSVCKCLCSQYNEIFFSVLVYISLINNIVPSLKLFCVQNTEICKDEHRKHQSHNHYACM